MNKIKEQKTKISILGAGSWGGTLAWLLSNQGYKISLWTFSKEEWNLLNRTKTLLRPKKVRDRKSTRLNSSHSDRSRMPSSA